MTDLGLEFVDDGVPGVAVREGQGGEQLDSAGGQELVECLAVERGGLLPCQPLGSLELLLHLLEFLAYRKLGT